MSAPLRYPEGRPSWLGTWQAGICDRCLTSQDASEPHPCPSVLCAEHGVEHHPDPPTTPTETTHYAVVSFPGDLDGDHPDEALRGSGPRLDLIACGSEQFCWDVARTWTETHPLGRDQTIEVLTR